MLCRISSILSFRMTEAVAVGIVMIVKKMKLHANYIIWFTKHYLFIAMQTITRQKRNCYSLNHTRGRSIVQFWMNPSLRLLLGNRWIWRVSVFWWVLSSQREKIFHQGKTSQATLIAKVGWTCLHFSLIMWGSCQPCSLLFNVNQQGPLLRLAVNDSSTCLAMWAQTKSDLWMSFLAVIHC